MITKLSYKIYIFSLITISILATSCDQDKKAVFSEEQITAGKNLVMEAKCNFCHTPYTDTEIGNSEKLLSGHPSESNIPDIPNVPVGSQEWLEFVANLNSTVWIDGNTVVFSANITPDKETGIGKWSEETFITTLRTGKHPGWKRDLKKPMPWLDYATLSNDQLTAIYAYLMSIEPVNNRVPDPVKFK